MDKRTIIAFILIGLIFLLLPFYTQLINPPSDVQQQPTITKDTVYTEAPQDTEFVRQSEPERTRPIENHLLTAAADTLTERIVEVDTDLYHAQFSSRGGALVSFELKKYSREGDGEIDLAEFNGASSLKLKCGDDYLLSEITNYSTESENLELSAGKPEGEISFEWSAGAGEAIRKIYRFRYDQYSFDMDVIIEGGSELGCDDEYYLTWDAPMPITELAAASEDNSHIKGYAMFGGEVLDFDDADGAEVNREEKSGQTAWTATKSKYFTSIIVPRSNPGSGFYVEIMESPETFGTERIDRKLVVNGIRMPADTGGEVSDRFTVYVGPIDYFILRDYGVELESIVDMGWSVLRPFSVAILWLLIQLHTFIPNYGFALIIFSIIIKILLLPLSRKSMSSMTKMQEIQPKIKELQEKYKKDPKKLQAESMKLYKEHGVNPLGGCLPLLLQMPLFFALYSVLRSTIELRGADFMLWLTDLSIPDPYYVLPIIMGVTMFIQQKMTMKDPKQKMMVYIMPVVLTFIFLGMPAGLVLYWTMFNILSFLEQLYVKSRTQPSPATQ